MERTHSIALWHPRSSFPDPDCFFADSSLLRHLRQRPRLPLVIQLWGALAARLWSRWICEIRDEVVCGFACCLRARRRMRRSLWTDCASQLEMCSRRRRGKVRWLMGPPLCERWRESAETRACVLCYSTADFCCAVCEQRL